jgi:hypothetical protein
MLLVLIAVLAILALTFIGQDVSSFLVQLPNAF